MFENIRKDYTRYVENAGTIDFRFFLNMFLTMLKSPGFFTTCVHRFGFWIDNYVEKSEVKIVRYPLIIVYNIGKYFSVVFCKIMIEESSDIGPGLYLSKNGGSIIGVKKMGRNCSIHEKVTIGLGIEQEAPILGNNVTVNKNSVIYGKISIGSNVVIHQDTVLSKSVPANCEIEGNPGRIIKIDIPK